MYQKGNPNMIILSHNEAPKTICNACIPAFNGHCVIIMSHSGFHSIPYHISKMAPLKWIIKTQKKGNNCSSTYSFSFIEICSEVKTPRKGTRNPIILPNS